MAWVQTDLDAIDAAIASGELIVRYADRTVQYRSIAELLLARSPIKQEVDATAGTLPVRGVFVNSVKGW